MKDNIKSKLIELIKSGQLAPFAKEHWFSLDDTEAMLFIRQGMATAPMSIKMASSETKTTLRLYIVRKLTPVCKEDLRYLTEDSALKLLELARQNAAEKNINRFEFEYTEDTCQATKTQISEIKNLIKNGFLKPLAVKTLSNLTGLSAKQMIFIGHKIREDSHAS